MPNIRHSSHRNKPDEAQNTSKNPPHNTEYQDVTIDQLYTRWMVSAQQMQEVYEEHYAPFEEYLYRLFELHTTESTTRQLHELGKQFESVRSNLIKRIQYYLQQSGNGEPTAVQKLALESLQIAATALELAGQAQEQAQSDRREVLQEFDRSIDIWTRHTPQTVRLADLIEYCQSCPDLQQTEVSKTGKEVRYAD